MQKASQLHDAFESLERLTANAKADMSRVTERSAESILTGFCPKFANSAKEQAILKVFITF